MSTVRAEVVGEMFAVLEVGSVPLANRIRVEEGASEVSVTFPAAAISDALDAQGGTGRQMRTRCSAEVMGRWVDGSWSGFSEWLGGDVTVRAAWPLVRVVEG